MIDVRANFDEFFRSYQIFLNVVKYHASGETSIWELLRLIHTIKRLLQKLFNLIIIVVEFLLVIPFEFFRERYISDAFLDAPYRIIVLLV